jgi:hypothetical protein
VPKIKHIAYKHHGNPVWVRVDLKGRHREFCLCHSCKLFKPDTPQNCEIAASLFSHCIRHQITTPVWECPKFQDNQES